MRKKERHIRSEAVCGGYAFFSDEHFKVNLKIIKTNMQFTGHEAGARINIQLLSPPADTLETHSVPVVCHSDICS